MKDKFNIQLASWLFLDRNDELYYSTIVQQATAHNFYITPRALLALFCNCVVWTLVGSKLEVSKEEY